MSVLADALSSVGRSLAGVGVPFTPATYDAVFPGSLPGLPNVTADSWKKLGIAYSCTVVISEDIGKVPLQVFEARDDGTKNLARGHELYDVLHTQANDELGALEFREWMTAIAVNRGYAVAEILPKRGKRIGGLKPLHPDRIKAEAQADGTWDIEYDDAIRGRRALRRDQVFILRGRFGRGVMYDARREFEKQLAMQGLIIEMYGRGLRSPGYLSAKTKLDAETRKRLREALDEYMGGGERAGRPMLLEQEMEWKTISLSLEDAQFVLISDHNIGEICRWYRVPLHKAQQLAPGTHASLSQQAVDYVTDSLVAWAVRWEQAIRRDLIANPRFIAEHNLDGLLRGDAKDRFEAYKIAVAFGWMTRAEVRAKENLNPLPGLDEPLVPLNMATSVAAGSTSAGTQSYLRLFVRDGAARCVRKETAALAKMADKGEWSERAIRDLYREQAEFVARVLHLPDETAAEYADRRATAYIEAGPTLLDTSDTEIIADLTETALDKVPFLQLPAGPFTEPGAISDLVEIAA